MFPLTFVLYETDFYIEDLRPYFTKVSFKILYQIFIQMWLTLMVKHKKAKYVPENKTRICIPLSSS